MKFISKVARCAATLVTEPSATGNNLFRAVTSQRGVAAHLREGGLIAYPTESCYGLGCDPNNRAAVLRLLKLKQRPQHKGLILIASHYQQLTGYIVPLSDSQQQHLRLAGLQAITYLMPAKHTAPRWLRGASDSLAVRLTGHPEAAKLCAAIDLALVSTSANLSGLRPAKTYSECQRRFGNKVWVLPGRIGKRKKPSTIKVWGSEATVRY